MPTPKTPKSHTAKTPSVSELPDSEFTDLPESNKVPLYAERLKHARIPQRFWTADIDSCGQSAINYVQDLEDNLRNGYGLMLIGPHGVGKTYAACAILKEALRIYGHVMFVWAPDLVNAYKPDAPAFDPENGITLPEAYRNRALLVIDDLGNEYRGAQSGFAEQHVVNLIRERASQKRATIITTNLKPDELQATYGPGFNSLLSESAVTIQLRGEDRRKTTNKA